MAHKKQQSPQSCNPQVRPHAESVDRSVDWSASRNCFNDCAMGPYVGLSSFSLSNVLGKFIVNYRGLL